MTFNNLFRYVIYNVNQLSKNIKYHKIAEQLVLCYPPYTHRKWTRGILEQVDTSTSSSISRC